MKIEQHLEELTFCASDSEGFLPGRFSHARSQMLAEIEKIKTFVRARDASKRQLESPNAYEDIFLMDRLTAEEAAAREALGDV